MAKSKRIEPIGTAVPRITKPIRPSVVKARRPEPKRDDEAKQQPRGGSKKARP